MNYSKTDHDIAVILSHTCDVSLRDGMQCLYNNTWQIEDLVCVAKKFNEISQIVEELTGQRLTIEAVGGDTFNAAIRLKGEDPFENSKRLKEAMPDCRVRSLTRGRQLLGFCPVSDKIIVNAVKESAVNGVDLFRVFDMLNRIDNLSLSIKAILEYRNHQLDRGIPPHRALGLELCICYISEPEEKIPVVTIDDYIQMGQVFMREANQHMRKHDPAVDLAIKDYAGLLTPEKSMALIKGLRTALKNMVKANELTYLPNLVVHSHGDKAGLLKHALQAGANYVDTSIGKLSGGVSHTNIFDYLDACGIPCHGMNSSKSLLLKKLKEAEDLIQILSKKYEEYRTPDIPIQQIYASRLAGGAVSAVQNTLKGQRQNLEIFWKKNGIPKSQFLTEQESFHTVLSLLSDIWNRSGRENTVTPGSRIFSDIAILALMHGRKMTPEGQITQMVFPPYQYLPTSYKQLMMGRFGDNQKAIDKIGDPDILLLQKAFLIESTLNEIVTLTNQEQTALSIGQLLGKTTAIIAARDLRKLDFVQLAMQGTLEKLKTKISLLTQANPSPTSKKLIMTVNLGKLPEDTVFLRTIRPYVAELLSDGLITEQQVDRALLLKAMSDPNQPNQVRHMYEYQRTGKLPQGSTLLDMRGYVAKLHTPEILVPDQQGGNALKDQSLEELAAQLAAIKIRQHDPTSPHRYETFVIHAMEAVKHTLLQAGFTEALNGTSMGIQKGMHIFRELVNEKK